MSVPFLTAYARIGPLGPLQAHTVRKEARHVESGKPLFLSETEESEAVFNFLP